MTRMDDLASLTAACLTAAGLQVSGPDPGDADGCRLVIACHGAECALMVSDAADAELWWTPLAAEAADPHSAADLAAALLSGEPGARQGQADVAPRLLGRARRDRVGAAVPLLAARPVRRRPRHGGHRLPRAEPQRCPACRALTPRAAPRSDHLQFRPNRMRICSNGVALRHDSPQRGADI
jgi:hypothetical protein